MPALTPERRMHVIDVENADAEIRAYLEGLRAEAERAWCEVFFPAPTHLVGEERAEWLDRQGDAFDAVELLDDGSIVTLPPYAELRAEAD